jgi:exodeoxyribonuclease VII small subunit
MGDGTSRSEAVEGKSYSQCLDRLRFLVGQLEDAQVDVDGLASVVQESVELIATCRERLRSAQSAVDTLLSGLTEQQPAPPAAIPAPAAPPTRRRSAPAVAKLDDFADLSDPFAE